MCADLSDVFFSIKRMVGIKEYMEQLVVLIADNDNNVIGCLSLVSGKDDRQSFLDLK